MVHFEKATAFVYRVCGALLGMIGEKSRNELSTFNKKSLSEEQKIIKEHYASFKQEVETNLLCLPKESYSSYFAYLIAEFPVPTSYFQGVNALIQQLVFQHGADFQEIAWVAMQNELQIVPFTDEVMQKAVQYFLIATGGDSYYQNAIAEIERQKRLLIKPAAISVPISTYVPLHKNKTDNEVVTNTIRKREGDTFTLRQVALMYAYQGWIIPKTADDIAKKYGHKAGQKLYEHYGKISSSKGRVGEDIIGRKLAPMIKDIEAIIPYLTGLGQQKAEKERQTLEIRK